MDSERDGHRVAFNLALEEFGFDYQWDEALYGRLLRTTGGQRRIDGFLASKGLPEADRAPLVPALHARKTEIMSELVEAGVVEVRPGARRLLDEMLARRIRLAVATTGSRGWVARLLRRLLPGVEFEVIVTGDEVRARKPDPEAFSTALARLGMPAAQAVAVCTRSAGRDACATAAARRSRQRANQPLRRGFSRSGM